MAEKTITQILRDRSAEFIRDPEGTESEQSRIARLATAAVLGGKTSDAWLEYMKENAVNNKQLRRLRGLDDMISEDWGEKCLAYIAGGPPCSIDSLARADIYLTEEMAAGLSVSDDPDFNTIDAGFPDNAEA